MSVNNSMEAAALMIKQFDDLKLGNGIVFTVPNPRPIQPSQSVNTLIRQSIEEANARGISGAAITPFLLQRIQQMTEGQSLASNISLALNNCSVGADIAFNYAKQKQKLSSPGNVIDLRKKFTGPREKNQSSVLVFGGAVIDHVAFPNKSLTRDMLGTSNPGTMITSYGGVGRNIAECIGRLQGHVRLITAVGNDSLGEGLITHAKTECGIDTADILVGDDTCRTASYTAVHNHDGGDLLVAIADMDIFPRKLNAAYTREVFEKVCGKGASLPKIVVADGNMSPETFQYIASKSLNLGIPLFFECTSVAKCVLPITSNSLQQVLPLVSNDFF